MALGKLMAFGEADGIWEADVIRDATVIRIRDLRGSLKAEKVFGSNTDNVNFNEPRRGLEV
jgi:hypothetical protein